MSGKHGAGKGSRYRPIDQKKYDENWEKCFGKKKKNPNKGLMQPGGIINYTDIPPSNKTQGDKQ